MACQLAQEGDLARVVAVVRSDRREHFKRRLATPTGPWTSSTMSFQALESVSKVLDGVSPVRVGGWRRGARPANGGVVRHASFLRKLGCSFLDTQLLVPSLEFGAPPLTLVKVLGAAIVCENRERQLRETVGCPPVFRRFEQGAPDSSAFKPRRPQPRSPRSRERGL